jgi:hypothetical protein
MLFASTCAMPPQHDTSSARILIGTPAYRSQVDLDYLHSIISFFREDVPFSLLTIGNESLITRARNAIASAFYHAPDFTHLFFLDADVGIDAASVRRLIAHDRDVVGAPVPLKTVREGGERIYNYTEVLGDAGDGLLRVAHLGTAALLLSRKAVSSLVDAAQARGDVYTFGRDGEASTQPTQYDIFQVGVRAGEYLSEDFWACQALRGLGFDIHVDATLRVRHNGSYRY